MPNNINKFKTISPFDGTVLATYNMSTPEEVKVAVKNAKLAFEAWSSLNFDERSLYLKKLADELDNEADSIGMTITNEMGRVEFESVGEVKKSAAFLRYFADNSGVVEAKNPISVDGIAPEGKQAYSIYAPRGVVAIIKPWNAPLQQTIWALAPALMSGCTAVIKPSEYTPATAIALQQAIEKSNFPEFVVQTLIGDGTVGSELVNSEVDVVAFTGSYEVGQHVAERAAYGMKKSILELSGKDYLIVDPNFKNLELLTNGIVYGAFSNCGHWCSSIEAALIPDIIYDEVAEQIKKATEALRLGRKEDLGPISNSTQYNIITSLIEDAVSKGASILCGGRKSEGNPKGLFFEPTVLIDVPDNAKIEYENAFGPVIVLKRVKDTSDAVKIANNSVYGLGASVWTESEDFANLMIKELKVGMVWVNEPLQSIASCPWSVTKNSGIGVELGINGVKEFMFEKVVQYQFGNSSSSRAWYFPYNS